MINWLDAAQGGRSEKLTVVNRVLVLEQACLEEKQPAPVDPRVDFTSAAFPVKCLVGAPIAPQRVDVDHGKSTISLFRDRHAHNVAIVMKEIV
jgi:hypothetical protein